MNKYKARKTEGLDIRGNVILFDSKAEAARNAELVLMEKMGAISHLERQVSYTLIPKQEGERACTARIDFRYRLYNGKVIVEDVKGVRTEVWKMKRKLMLHVHGIRVVEV